MQNVPAVPSRKIEKVIESAAMRLILAVEMAVKGGDITSSPGKSYEQNERLEVLEMVKVELIL